MYLLLTTMDFAGVFPSVYSPTTRSRNLFTCGANANITAVTEPINIPLFQISSILSEFSAPRSISPRYPNTYAPDTAGTARTPTTARLITNFILNPLSLLSLTFANKKRLPLPTNLRNFRPTTVSPVEKMNSDSWKEETPEVVGGFLSEWTTTLGEHPNRTCPRKSGRLVPTDTRRRRSPR